VGGLENELVGPVQGGRYIYLLFHVTKGSAITLVADALRVVLDYPTPIVPNARGRR